MSRIRHRILPGLLAILLLLIALLGWLAGTESGLRLFWRAFLGPAVPALSAGAVHGRLAGTLRLADVRYEDDQLLFTARALRLDWTPASLFHGRLHVRALAAEGVRYEQRSAGDGAPLALPARISLPIALEVEDLSVHDLVVIAAPAADPLSLDSLTLAGRYRGSVLAISRLAVRQAAFTADGALTLQTQAGYPLTGSVRWQAVPPGYAPLTAQAGLSGDLHTLRVEQTVAPPYAMRLDLTLTEPLAALRVDAALTLQDSDLAAIHAAWPDMRLAGTVGARGAPDALSLKGALAVQDPVTGALQLVLDGTLQPDVLQFETLQLTAAGGPTRLDGQGRIGFGAAPAFDFQAHWQALAWPLTGTPEYASRQGRLTLSGTPDAYRLEAEGDLHWADRLTGQLALRARSASTPGNWQVTRARLSGGGSRIEANGQIGDVFDLAWRVDAPRLGDLVPQASGRLRGSGTLRGRLPEAALEVRATGAGIAWRAYRLGALDIDGAVKLAAGQTSRLKATLGDAQLAGVPVQRVVVEGAGTTDRHRAHLLAETDQGNADVDVSGRWDGTAWRFKLHDASLAKPPLAPWRLAQPVSGELAQTGLQLPEHCWTSDAARVCLRFAGSLDDFRGAVTLQALPLAYFSALFPESVSLQGDLDGQGEFGREAGRATRVALQLQSTPLQLTLQPEAGEAPQRVSFAPGQAAFTLERERASLSLGLPFAGGPGGVQGRAGLSIPAGGDWMRARLQGELTLDWPDIGPAAEWIPEVADLHGRIDGRMQIDGTPAAPRLQGRLALSEGAARLVTPGLRLEAVRVELAGQPAGDVRVDISARSGGGTLQGDGFADPVARRVSLALRGTKFQVMNTPEAKLFASPDLQLTVDADRADVSGRIDIPSAQLRPKRPPPTAVSVSPDQVIVAADGESGAAPRYPLHARVRVVLGDVVDIDGLGLTGKLHGDVLLTDEPGRPVSASGELSIEDGHYEAYGQQLTIRTGRLLFAGGAVTEPGVDIEAVRRPATDVLVGVKARGPLRAPKFTVFSEPTMPQSAQLSWLVLGRPLESGTSDSQRSALQTAALMLGLNGGESIGKRLGDELGLDEVSIGREPGADVNQAALLVGKYLTPELFVSYGIGLFDPVATLRLRYALTSHWKLVGETAALSSSADLFYEIDSRR